MIKIIDVSKKYKSIEVLNSINMDIKQGEIIALLGHNGSGKSTLIKCLTGVLKTTKGKILIDDLDVYKYRKKLIKNMGIIFNQKPSFIVDLTVYDNLLFFKAMYGLKNIEFKESINLIDTYLNISCLFDKPYRKLSFGERVKCEIASIFLHCPKYIVLDEPTIGLDYIAKKNLYKLLLYFKETYNSTVIIVTHEVDYIEQICTRAIILKNGKKIYDGQPNETYRFMEKTINITVKYAKEIDDNLASKLLVSNNLKNR